MLIQTDDQHYYDIADAIRTKLDTDDTFLPSEMATAIGDIPTGGGDTIDVLIDRSITSVSSPVTTVGAYAFQNCLALTTASFANATTVDVYAFAGCAQLSAVMLPLCQTIGDSAFSSTGSIMSLQLPVASLIGASAFYYSAIRSVTIGNGDYGSLTIARGAFQNCGSLNAVTVHNRGNATFNTQAFSNCRSLTNLTVNTSYPCTLSSVDALENTAIADGTGSIYVPAQWVSYYKTAANWSMYANQIQAIS